MEEGQSVGILIGFEGGFMDQPPDREMRHQEAVELLAYQVRGLAAQNNVGTAQMGFELTECRLDFPAFMVERRQLGGGRLLMVQDAGHQPIDRLGIGNTVQAVVDAPLDARTNRRPVTPLVLCRWSFSQA